MVSYQPLDMANATRTDPYRVIEEIKRLAVEQLGNLPAALYGPIEESFNAAAIKDPAAAQLEYHDQAALWVLRQHQATHVMRFRQQIAQGFDDFRALKIRSRGDLPLGLIDEKELEFHLAGQRLVETVDQRYREPLHNMDGSMRALSAVLGVPPAVNPIGANRLASAFIETFGDEEITDALRSRMFQQYEKELVGVLGSLYESVNALLARNGYRVATSMDPVAPSVHPEVRTPSDTRSWDSDVVPVQPHSPPQPIHSGSAQPSGASSGYQPGLYQQPASANGAMPAQHSDASSVDAENATAGPSQAQPPSTGMPASAPMDPVSAAELGELRMLLRAWREGGLASAGDSAAAAAGRPTTGAPQMPGGASSPSQGRGFSAGQASTGKPASSGGSSSGHAAPLAPPRELRVDEVLTVASLLQSEPADAFIRALSSSGRLADVIREQLNDGSRRLGMDPDQTCFSAVEEDAIDLVALLFDSLFQNHQMEDRARRMYARLVLPFVKIALSDESIFVQPEHPARRLFDAITEACAGNNAETPQERELLDRASAVTENVVAEYNEDLAIFEAAYAELDALLQQQRRRIDLQEDRAAKATLGRERLDHARRQADTILARRLAAPPLSRAVADFLSTPWRHHLVQTALREGSDSERYTDAVALGDALVAADRLAGENRGRELADRLWLLQPLIVDCLASSGLDKSAAEHGMAVLLKAFAYPDTPRDLHEARPTPGVGEDVAEEAERWLGDAADPVNPNPAMVEHMKRLQAGDWLQLTDVHGQMADAKVAWSSPLTSRRLLVNRRGLRMLVASVEQLAVMAVAGRLHASAERTAFEQALHHVRQRLSKEAPEQ